MRHRAIRIPNQKPEERARLVADRLRLALPNAPGEMGVVPEEPLRSSIALVARAALRPRGSQEREFMSAARRLTNKVGVRLWQVLNGKRSTRGSDMTDQIHEIRGCQECPAARWRDKSGCGVNGRAISWQSGTLPSHCPLRTGDVILRAVQQETPLERVLRDIREVAERREQE